MSGNRWVKKSVDRRHYRAPEYNPRGWSAGSPWLRSSHKDKATAFEEFIRSLGDSPEALWQHDRRVRAWVHAHKNTHYVPEFLLRQLHERVLLDGEESW